MVQGDHRGGAIICTRGALHLAQKVQFVQHQDINQLHYRRRPSSCWKPGVRLRAAQRLRGLRVWCAADRPRRHKSGHAIRLEHILEFQKPKQLFDHLNQTLGPFDHSDPANSAKLSYCEYVREHWDIAAVPIPGLDTSQGVGASLTPAEHVAQQYLTHLWETDEYVLFEHLINTPAKGKAWEGENAQGTQIQIISTAEWVTDLLPTVAGAGKMIKVMRCLIGSRMYHNDVQIRDVLRAQKDRVGNVLDVLDKTILPANRKNPASYKPWVPQGLKSAWECT